MNWRKLLAGCSRGCFLKPRYGSGAGGIMAVRYQPRQKKWVVYTTLQKVDRVIHNTKRINRLSTEKDDPFGGSGDANRSYSGRMDS